MTLFRDAIVETHTKRLMCSKKHAKVIVTVHGDPTDGDWCGQVVSIDCETCGEMLWYNGS